FLIIAILPGGRFCSFCFCAAVFGVIVLKPAATSMLSLFCVLVCVVVAQPTMAIATASTKINGDLKGFIEPNFGRYASIAILDLSLMGPRLTGNKTKGAAVHALLLVRVGRINLPRSHLDSWVRPAFNLLIFSIGLAPPRHPNALERSCWSARHDPRQAGVHISC